MLWRHVLQTTSSASPVLSCQLAFAERPLAFSALDDLFGDVIGENFPALPGPRRRAMELALLRDRAPEARSARPFDAGRLLPSDGSWREGFLDVVRILSGRSPLVLAIDDAQWLDRPSADALEFCIRRLEHEPVSILLTVRTDDPVPFGLDHALPSDRLSRLRLGPLSLGAIGEILRSRLGAVLPRYALTGLYDTCGGNPFYALECARLLLSCPRMSLTKEPIPIPQSLGDLGVIACSGSRRAA
jgi:hypothetical protein